MEKYRVILIDDEENQRESLAGFLRKKKFDVKTAASADEGLELFKKSPADIIFTDFKMAGKTGEDVLTGALEIDPAVPVIIMTAFGSIEGAVSLMKKGAFDYLQKPIELEELMMIIDRARERQNLISENIRLKKQISEKYSFANIISQSGEMEEVLNIAGRVAPSKASVMIRGESGTGKELIARAIHLASDRQDKPFIVVNCAAMPDTLFESELFGHEKGAYTGANTQRIGKFELADGGTLFIDEVGDIPLQIQVKLLRAVQFGQIERLGGNRTIDLDVRIITATNRNLEEMIKENEFREDLYYRFNVVQVNIPPLRKRKSDIPLLAEHFIGKYSDINGKRISSLSKEALEKLMRYEFPGNVRELENIVQRAVVMSRSEIVTTKDLPMLSGVEAEENCSLNDIQTGDLNQKVEELEMNLIRKALDESVGNQVKAADILNISERTLRYKLTKYGLK